MATLTVRKDGSGTHTEIQAAIYDASAGDVINIEAGTFTENLDLYKGVALEGAGREVSVVQGSQETAVVRSFTCALGSTTLTMAGGTAGLKKGRLITGTAISANTRIVDVQANSITISAATTAARSTATSATMPAIEATIRVRGSGGVIKNLKVIGFDSPSAASEMAAVFYRNTGAGSAAATNQMLEDSWLVADGEYAILTDAIANVQNLTIRNNKITGKTFVGQYPATGNQFSVNNVPRQLVTIQSANIGVSFTGNTVEGTTGGLLSDGVTMSFNTACTIDPSSAVVSNNIVRGVHGYGYGLRVRGANANVQGNTIHSYGSFSSNGFLISGAGALNLQNSNLLVGLVGITQPVAGQPVAVQMSKQVVEGISKVQASPAFSNSSSWEMVTYVFKREGSAARLVSSFKDPSQNRQMKLRPGMVSGQKFELNRIIIMKMPNRQLLVIKRDEIPDASTFDFTLA